MANHLSVLAGLAALSLTGCQADARYAAGKDIRDFLIAARTGDAVALETHVDRPKVIADLADQLPRATPRADVIKMADRLLRPSSFAVSVVDAAPNAALPSALTFAMSVKAIPGGRFCLPPGPKQFRCALTFARQGSAWKLVGLNAAYFLRREGRAG